VLIVDKGDVETCVPHFVVLLLLLLLFYLFIFFFFFKKKKAVRPSVRPSVRRRIFVLCFLFLNFISTLLFGVFVARGVARQPWSA
jgi:hypothetical protein